MFTLTWIWGSTPTDPAEIPTIPCTGAICVEDYFHYVAPGSDWRNEISPASSNHKMAIWIGTAALFHQGSAVPISNFDIVSLTGGIHKMNIKVGELYSQYRPTLYFYSLRLVNVVWIVTRVVWGGDNTCGKKTFKLL